MYPGNPPHELDRLGGLGFRAAQAFSPPDGLHHQPGGASPAPPIKQGAWAQRRGLPRWGHVPGSQSSV